MTSVDERIDAQVAALRRRDRRWSWFLIMIPVQALACLAAYMLGRLDMGTAALAFFGMWVPTLLFYFFIDSLMWKRFERLREDHPQNVAIVLLKFVRDGKRNDSGQHFTDFEKMKPAFQAWFEDGMPALPEATVELLTKVADKFPSWWLGIGHVPDKEVYPLMYTALMRANQTECAERMNQRFAKHFDTPMSQLG
jgi:hypothetical protein